MDDFKEFVAIALGFCCGLFYFVSLFKAVLRRF